MMPSLSTHVIDAAGGGACRDVEVKVSDAQGAIVAAALTDADGRIASLAPDLGAGLYSITWATKGSFLLGVAVTVDLAEERHYHVPLLVSAASAVTYLGV
jgi:5-hydroxyisourate hydrolase